MSDNIWTYRAESGYTSGSNLVGYRVEASDGHIGKIDKHSEEVGSAYVVVDTGPWILGKHVLLPAGTIRRVDSNERKVFVDRTKTQIKNSPEFDPEKHVGDPGYHQQVGNYYNQDPRI